MIAIINGPNINLVGIRQPEVYGSLSFDRWFHEYLDRRCDPADPAVVAMQSNSEGKLIDMIQKWGFDDRITGIVINPGAYAHYSYAIADAIRSVPVPVIEVHISNIHAREDFRHTSVTAAAAKGVVTGLGFEGYAAAISWLAASTGS